MNIFKVLSRGAKKPSKTAAAKQPVAPRVVPSAGAEIKAQLFGDGGKKRKRESDVVAEKPETAENKGTKKGKKNIKPVEDDLPEVDFFAMGGVKEEVDGGHSGEGVPEVEEESEEVIVVEEAPERMGEEECKQVLKEHRLKVSLLRGVDRGNKRKNLSKKEKKKEMAFYPEPLTGFGELRSCYGVHRQILANIEVQAYKEPTEVQMEALPLLLNAKRAIGDGMKGFGKEDKADLLVVAPTGSGKTMGFMVPAIESILRRRTEEKSNEARVSVVILVPTRELGYQIVNEGRKLARGTSVKIVMLKKGMRLAGVEDAAGVSLDEEEDAEAEVEDRGDDESVKSNDDTPLTPVDILVTTPMLLLNYLNKNPESPLHLATVTHLVLDEADILLDQLFREQTTALLPLMPHPHLTRSLWSATIASNIEALITQLLPSTNPLIRLVVGLKDTAVPNIRHHLTFTGSELGKIYAIRSLLRPAAADEISIRPPFIVFTQTINRATALQDELRYDIPLAAGGSSRIASLHSGLTDNQRAAIMRQFRAGEIWILITTDVLARGIDFAGVNGVVNYDIPTSTATYIHRAGRTGRAGRDGGIAVTLWTKDDIPYVKIIANVIAASDKLAGRTGADVGVPASLLASLPEVSKQEKKKLKERGVEARRSGGQSAKITTKSGWERQKENNRKVAVENTKRKKWLEKERRRQEKAGGASGPKTGDEEEFGGFDD